MLNEVIRITRIANDMTISTLSEKSTVSKSYITEIEKGKKRPSKDILNKLSLAFNLEEYNLHEFDELHNSIIKTKEKLYAYRTLLISILEFYDNREKQDSVMEEKNISPIRIDLDSYSKN